MDIRLDKCLTFGAAMCKTKFQQILPTVALAKGKIHSVLLEGHFKYLGKIFDFELKYTIPKQEMADKLGKMLNTLSALKIRSQTKLKIFSRYVTAQFTFELKIYNFTDTYLSSVIDKLCTFHIRKWLEFPASSCVNEWASAPIKFCGLGIPTFAHRAGRMRLTKRNALMTSKNAAIRDLWSASKRSNIIADSMLESLGRQSATTSLKNSQSNDSVSHFLGLKSQGLSAKVVSESVLTKNIASWKQTIDLLPEHVFIFVRKAMMNQLPTLKNLKLWGRSATDLCPRCGCCQSNKHVLSNCSSPEVLARYLDRHNQILKIIALWIKSNLGENKTLYCDLSIAGARHVSDIFNGFRPDLAIVLRSAIIVGELTICHETNLQTSRDFKLKKYANLSSSRSSAFRHYTVTVHTIEVSTLGFVVAEPNFFKLAQLPNFSPALTSEMSRTAVVASREIYCNR